MRAYMLLLLRAEVRESNSYDYKPFDIPLDIWQNKTTGMQWNSKWSLLVKLTYQFFEGEIILCILCSGNVFVGWRCSTQGWRALIQWRVVGSPKKEKRAHHLSWRFYCTLVSNNNQLHVLQHVSQLYLCSSFLMCTNHSLM